MHTAILLLLALGLTLVLRRLTARHRAIQSYRKVAKPAKPRTLSDEAWHFADSNPKTILIRPRHDVRRTTELPSMYEVQ